MTDIRKELTRTFDLASLRHEASQKLTGDDWEQFRQIKDAHAKQRKEIDKSYTQNEPALLAKAKEQILTSQRLTPQTPQPRPPIGASAKQHLSQDQLDRQAMRRVDAAKQGDHAQVDQNEARTLRALVESRAKRETHRDQARRDFGRAAPDHPKRHR